MTGRTRLLGPVAGFFVVSGALLSAVPAFGQSATDQSTTAQTGAAADILQEVVVTAERRATNIQTTPISVIAVSGSDLKAASVTSINNLQVVAPDLTVQTGGANVLINIRGIGIEPVGADSLAGVVVVRDGLVNNTAGVGVNAPFYDIADVEVLRGPQGTFAGDNSTGGAIQITSQNPNFRGFNGYVTAKVATYSDTGLEGAVNLPVNDSMAMRVAFNLEKRGSFFYNAGGAIDGPNGSGPYFIPGSPTCGEPTCASSPGTTKTGSDPGNLNDKDMRLGLLWKPTDNLQSLTKIEVDSHNTDGIPTQPNNNTFLPLGPGLPCPIGHGVAPNCTETYIAGYSGSPYVLNSDVVQKYDEQVNMYSEELRYTFSGGTVARFIGGTQQINQTTLASSTFDAIDNQNHIPNPSISWDHVFSSEVDLISPATNALSWIAGAAWSNSAEQFDSFSTNTAFPFSTTAPEHVFWVDGEDIYGISEGVFGQLSWQINPTLQFQIGARLGWDRDSGHGALEIQAPLFAKPIYLLALGRSDEAGDNAVPTGKIGLNWTPVPGQYLYVFAARGYKTGLGNLGLVPPTTKEWDNDYELGWKGTLAGGHVLTQLGGYYMQYYQLQESIFNPNNVTGTSVGNIPSSTIEGIEASMQSQFGHLGFSISGDYNKSKLGTLRDAATYKFPASYGTTNQCAPGEVANSNNTNCTDYAPFFVSLTGEALPYSPLYQGNATLKYDIPVGNMSLEPRVTFSYVAKSYGSLFQSDNFFLLPAHGLLSAYLDWTAGPWTTTVYGTNLSNKVYVANIGNTSKDYGSPRQIGMSVNRTF